MSLAQETDAIDDSRYANRQISLVETQDCLSSLIDIVFDRVTVLFRPVHPIMYITLNKYLWSRLREAWEFAGARAQEYARLGLYLPGLETNHPPFHVIDSLVHAEAGSCCMVSST